MSKVLKIYLEPKLTKEGKESNIREMRSFCKDYLNHSEQWLNGKKIAGARARACMHNIQNNASLVNREMIERDRA